MPKKPIREFDLNAFSERLSAESDRACAVLGAALADAKLEDVFKRRLQCSPKELKELLEGVGPLSTFSSRIRLARALAWIDETTQIDLDTVRSIRNDFAHSLDHDLSFSDQSVSDRCFNLRTANAFIDGFDDAAVAPDQNLSADVVLSMQAVFKTARQRYQLAVEFLAQHLDEIPHDSPAYSGSDLLQEIRALSANSRVRFSASATLNPSSPEPARRAL